MRHPNKKGEVKLSEAPMYIMLLVVIAIILGIGASILSTTSTSQCTGTSGTLTYSWNTSANACYLVNSTGAQISLGGPIAYNSTVSGLVGVNTFSGWVPTIAIVLAASIVIGLVLAYLVMRRTE